MDEQTLLLSCKRYVDHVCRRDGDPRHEPLQQRRWTLNQQQNTNTTTPATSKQDLTGFPINTDEMAAKSFVDGSV